MNKTEPHDPARHLSEGLEYLIAWTTNTEFKGPEIHIYGNPTGLRSLAKKLIEMADFDQSIGGFPDSDSEHHHYKVGCNTVTPYQHPLLTIGRADTKHNKNSLRDCFAPIQPAEGILAIR